MKKPDQLTFTKLIKEDKILRRLCHAAVGLMFVGVTTICGYFIYIQKKNKNSWLYKESFEILKQYEPVAQYTGAPWRVSKISSVVYDENGLEMVVPFAGNKGKAHLIIHALRSEDSRPVLSELEIELQAPPKTRWTFYKVNKPELRAQSDSQTESTITEPNTDNQSTGTPV